MKLPWPRHRTTRRLSRGRYAVLNSRGEQVGIATHDTYDDVWNITIEPGMSVVTAAGSFETRDSAAEYVLDSLRPRYR